MLRLALEENLYIRQKDDPIIIPWGYRIYRLSAPIALIKFEDGITDEYRVIELDAPTFESLTGKTFHLDIYDATTMQTIDSDEFNINEFGIGGGTQLLEKTLGLLGENIIEDSSESADFQDGHGKHSVITLYDGPDLITANHVFEWTRRFSGDFTPDKRFHIYDEKQVETI